MGDSTPAFGIQNNRTVSTPRWSEVLQFAGSIVDGVFCFQYGDTNDVAFWAPPFQLTQNNPDRMAVGKVVPHPNGGRAVVLAFPMRQGNFPNASLPAPRVLDRMLAELLGP